MWDLGTIPTVNNTKLKDFMHFKPVFILRNQASWVVALCSWIIDSRVCELTDNLKMKMVHFFVVWDKITQWHSTTTQQNWLLDRDVLEASNQCFCIVKTIFISYYFIFLIYSVVDTWFTVEEWNDKSFPNIWMSLYEYITVLLKKGKWEYCLVLNVDTETSENVAIFTAGSWSCGPCATICHVLSAVRCLCRIHSRSL